MKTFKSLVVVNAPLEATWNAVRDRLPDLVASMDDIEKVVVAERIDLDDGKIGLTNEWHAKMRVPDILEARSRRKPSVGPIAMSGTRPSGCADGPSSPGCCAVASTAQAKLVTSRRLAGAARAFCEGTFDLAQGALSGFAGALVSPLTPFIESIVTILIPKNLRKVIEAAARQPSSTP